MTPPGSAPPADERITPLYNEACERQVIGAVLAYDDAYDEVVGIVGADDFWNPAHAAVFRSVATLADRGSPTRPLDVATHMGSNLDRHGGHQFLLGLTQETESSPAHYARIVLDASRLRRAVNATATAKNLIEQSAGQSAAEVLAEVSRLMDDVTGEVAESSTRPIEYDVAEALEHIDTLQHNKNTISGVPTGFIDLDVLTQGLQPGQMVIVAARPAMGKSTLALDFCRAASIRHGIPSAFFSLEMDTREIVLRLLSSESRVGLQKIRSGELTEVDWERIGARVRHIVEAPFFVDDTPGLTMPTIRAKARRLVQRHGVRLIVVDYLQLMTGSRKVENRQQEVSEMSRGFKLLAKELEVPIVVLCQLNRNSEQRADKRPQVSDLRESGSLEQDADIVMLIHREDVYEKESTRAGEADIIVAKHRNGPTAEITLAFQGGFSRFVDMAPGHKE